MIGKIIRVLLLLIAAPSSLLGVALLTPGVSVYNPRSPPPIALTWVEVKPEPKNPLLADGVIFRRQIDFLRSPAVLEAALREPNVARLGGLPESTEERLRWLREHARIERDNGGLVRITVQGGEEEESIALVNALARACVKLGGPAPGSLDRPHVNWGWGGVAVVHPRAYLVTVPVLINDPLKSNVTGCLLLALALVLVGIAWWIRPAEVV